MRSALITVAVIIVFLGIGGFVWWRYFSGGPSLVASTPSTLPSSATVPVTPAAVSSTSPAVSNPASLAATRISSRLTKISQGPIVPGEVAVDIPAASASSSADVSIEFIERQSGNIFSYALSNGVLMRTSNKTLPGILRALWLPSGKTAYVTYLSGNDFTVVNTYGLAADGSGGFFLPQGLADIAVSSTSVLTLASGATGSVASVMKTDGSKSTTAFTSPLSALRIGMAGKGGYIAFTKPSQSVLGDVFFVNTAGGSSRLAGPLPGLVALGNHSGSSVLVSIANGGVMSMFLVDTATALRTPLPIATIADKCVWAADDASIYCAVPVAPPASYSYPDDWYQGAIHFTDRLWKIDVKHRFAQLVFDPSTASIGPLDAEALAVDPKASVLVFLNKTDGSLWSYAL